MPPAQEKLKIIARVYQEWAAEQNVQPDPAFSRDGRSQYPEGIEALSASAEAQADLYQRTTEALAAAGF